MTTKDGNQELIVGSHPPKSTNSPFRREKKTLRLRMKSPQLNLILAHWTLAIQVAQNKRPDNTLKITSNAQRKQRLAVQFFKKPPANCKHKDGFLFFLLFSCSQKKTQQMNFRHKPKFGVQAVLRKN